ncbi:hypothetical protein [Ensifer sp. SL37]|uniref:hypothetical protein n=1 Tax=Ensifer sp. SL37 TaxID=2995137 RepID=UPI002275FFFD|nr:hypothetical protein [Ensifer sp. SL37]MCY1740846.1 hypothetical protein [Ensifer sp. SL37]
MVVEKFRRYAGSPGRDRCRESALRAAAIAAIETGDESISERTLRIADYKGPVERRISIERQLVPG